MLESWIPSISQFVEIPDARNYRDSCGQDNRDSSHRKLLDCPPDLGFGVPADFRDCRILKAKAGPSADICHRCKPLLARSIFHCSTSTGKDNIHLRSIASLAHSNQYHTVFRRLGMPVLVLFSSSRSMKDLHSRASIPRLGMRVVGRWVL